MKDARLAAEAPERPLEQWRDALARHQQPSAHRAIVQLIDTGVPYVGLWCLIYLVVDASLWYAVPLAVVAGAFLVRVFIILHDCSHGSFFASRRANDVVGFLAGVLTFTPYHHWRWQHRIHHGTAGQLDRRGAGDIWTLTVQEYRESTPWRRAAYRLSRNPLVLFGVAPLLIFVFHQRWPSRHAGPRERSTLWWMNLALAGYVAAMVALFGPLHYLILQGSMWMVAGAAGIWLFYVQHQFEDTYWERTTDWRYVEAAMKGSSFYKLPRVLQWLSGNIGFHHIHHLNPRVPNYNLQRCHEADPFFQQVQPLTLWSSLRTLRVHLWDEEARKLVGFKQSRQTRRTAGLS